MGQPYQEKVYEIVNEDDKQVEESLLITLDNGVVLKPRPIPPLILARIERRFVYPPVPKVRDEDKGRDIENPSDPRYLAEIERVDEEKSMAQLDVIIALGTDLISVPENVYAPDQDEWIDEVEPFIGETIPRTGRARYLAWLKFYALSTATDIPTIARKALKRTGVGDEQVESALAGFRGEEARGTDPSHPDTQFPENGNSHRGTTGDSSTVL